MAAVTTEAVTTEGAISMEEAIFTEEAISMEEGSDTTTVTMVTEPDGVPTMEGGVGLSGVVWHSW